MLFTSKIYVDVCIILYPMFCCCLPFWSRCRVGHPLSVQKVDKVCMVHLLSSLKRNSAHENVNFLDFFSEIFSEIFSDVPGFGRGTGWAQRLLRPGNYLCAASEPLWKYEFGNWIWKLFAGRFADKVGCYFDQKTEKHVPPCSVKHWRREHQFPDNCEGKSFVEHGMSGSSKFWSGFATFDVCQMTLTDYISIQLDLRLARVSSKTLNKMKDFFKDFLWFNAQELEKTYCWNPLDVSNTCRTHWVCNILQRTGSVPAWAPTCTLQQRHPQGLAFAPYLHHTCSI